MFINHINWPYIYTLNADDAIERNSKYEAVLPYDKNLSIKSKEEPSVFKLHGDVNYEIRHEKSRLVFRKKEYLRSLTTNITMLDFLKLDMLHKNIVYIGCSLIDELDIASIVANDENINKVKNNKFIFLSKKPSFVDEISYKELGINTIIMFEQGAYDQVYQLMIEAFQHSAEKSDELSHLAGDIKLLEKDESDNKEFLVKGIVNINEKGKPFKKVIPHYYSERDIEAEVSDSLSRNVITIVKGKRVSGKTLLAYSILKKVVNKRVYLVDSYINIDQSSLLKLLGQKNSVILFDEGSLNTNSMKLIKDQYDVLKNNSCSLLICADNNDNDISRNLHLMGKKTKEFELKTTLTSSVLNTLNKKAKEVRLPTFTEGKHLLEKIYNVFKIIGEDNYIAKKVKKDEDLFFILYVIAVKHVVRGDDVYFSGLDLEKTLKVCQNYSPYIQVESLEQVEKSEHANFKIVSYANSWVITVLRAFFIEKGVDWCADVLMKYFQKLHSKNKSLFTDLRKFDSFNLIFTSSLKGAGALILGVYDRLESIEGEEAEFFVQKSKAYFNIYKEVDIDEKMLNCIRELDIALTWAETDGNKNTKRNILHTKSLICMKKYMELKEKTPSDAVRAVKAVYATLKEEFNDRYQIDLLSGQSRSGVLFNRFLTSIETKSHIELLSLKEEIQFINDCKTMKKSN